MADSGPTIGRPARIQDVAAAAGVSVATVSNVLNRPELVRPETAARVRSVVRELDYVANPAAAGLRNGRASAIGLVLPDVANSFYGRIARGAADAAYVRGFSLVLCHSGDDPTREEAYFSLLANQRAAGAVVVPRGAGPPRLARLRRRGIPLVLTDRSVPVTEGCSVAVDDVAGGRLAVDHLLRRDPRDVLVVNGGRGIRQCLDRHEGARRAVRGRPGVGMREVVVEEMTVDAGAAVARTLTTLPDAVFCTNDFLAAGLLRGLTDRGVRVPDDVAVVGFGDLDVARLAAVALTTVRQPVEDLGRAAVELLLDEVTAARDHTHEARVFAPGLVVRTSAGG